MENWNKRVRRTCVGVLLLALLLRLGGSGPMAAQDAENAAAFFLYLQTGRVAKPTGEFPFDSFASVKNVIAMPLLGASSPES